MIFITGWTVVQAVLTATSFLWGIQKFDLPQNQNPWPDWDKIWHGWLGYVGEGTRHAKFYANSFKEASRQMGKINANFFIYICLFSSTHPQVRPIKGFLRLIRQTTRFCTRKCLFSSTLTHSVMRGMNHLL